MVIRMAIELQYIIRLVLHSYQRYAMEFLLYSGLIQPIYSLTERRPHNSCNFLMVEIESFWVINFTYLLIVIDFTCLYFMMLRNVANCLLTISTTTIAVGIVSIIICVEILFSVRRTRRPKVRNHISFV